MKNLNLPMLLLLAANMVLTISCEKETITVQPLALRGGPQTGLSDCGYAPCEQAIAATKLAYQALANSCCDTLWVDITCCQDNLETFALVIVVPNGWKCRGQQPEQLHLR